ncbi:hypothetical protein B7486_59635, partial [cyanobacterium TDX16]
MRRLLAATFALLLAVALTACSDDGGDDESTSEDSVPASAELTDTGAASQEFCDEVEAQADLFEGSEEGATEDDLAAFDELVDAAPETIQPDLETVREAYVQISELPEDLDSIGEAFDILFDPEFIGAIEQVGIFLEGECGIDIETPSEAGLGEIGDADPEDGAGDDPAEDDGVSADGLRSYLEAEDPDLESRVQTVATVAGAEVSVGVRNLDDPAEAVSICEAVSGYVYDEVGDADV